MPSVTIPNDVVIDGSGYTISNIHLINQTALFDVNNGTIKNLIINNSGSYQSVNKGSQAILVNVNNGTISRALINADVEFVTYNANATVNNIEIGGIVSVNSNLIEKSKFAGNINAYANQFDSLTIGGLVSKVIAGSVEQSYTEANITVVGNANKLYVGSLVGVVQITIDATISNLYSVGKLTYNNTATTKLISGGVAYVTSDGASTLNIDHIYSAVNVAPINSNLGIIGSVNVVNVNYDKLFVLDSTVNSAI